MDWFTNDEKKEKLLKTSKILSSGKESKEEKKKMSSEEIEALAERKRKQYEEKTGNKGKAYKHKPKAELSKMKSYIDEHNERLRKKKDKSWFGQIMNAVKSDKKKNK